MLYPSSKKNQELVLMCYVLRHSRNLCLFIPIFLCTFALSLNYTVENYWRHFFGVTFHSLNVLSVTSAVSWSQAKLWTLVRLLRSQMLANYDSFYIRDKMFKSVNLANFISNFPHCAHCRNNVSSFTYGVLQAQLITFCLRKSCLWKRLSVQHRTHFD